VISTGVLHSVQEFVEIAFSRVGLDWRKHVVLRSDVLQGGRSAKIRPDCVRLLVGAHALSLHHTVRTMVAAEEGISWMTFGV
jgi:hypothetical protein